MEFLLCCIDCAYVVFRLIIIYLCRYWVINYVGFVELIYNIRIILGLLIEWFDWINIGIIKWLNLYISI